MQVVLFRSGTLSLSLSLSLSSSLFSLMSARAKQHRPGAFLKLQRKFGVIRHLISTMNSFSDWQSFKSHWGLRALSLSPAVLAHLARPLREACGAYSCGLFALYNGSLSARGLAWLGGETRGEGGSCAQWGLLVCAFGSPDFYCNDSMCACVCVCVRVYYEWSSGHKRQPSGDWGILWVPWEPDKAQNAPDITPPSLAHLLYTSRLKYRGCGCT